MDGSRASRARAIFDHCLELSESERESYLSASCQDAPELRAEVAALLQAHAEADRFLEQRVVARELVLASLTQDSLIGSRIGHYVIERLLGAGGMGVVYRATQDHPRRQVALKVIRAGLVSHAALRRFEHEAEILGSLHHPGIAQVYEAGAHEWESGAGAAGRTPYFAMELLEGATSIVDLARSRQLTIHERLQLFASACDALQFAHQKGVIHRDLKPGNLLVTREGAVKIIDFGIARAMDAEASIATRHGEILGTLGYMSPEQSAGDADAVDTRSDIYSLGVVLYQLLTDRLPYDLPSDSILHAAQVIRDVEPLRPSLIDRKLPSDLDAIVQKTLEKESARRYQTAGDLAADIRRHLRDEPILARTPTAGYQLLKFARRNKVLVGGVLSVMLALVLGAVATLWQAHVARAERDQANQAKVASDVAREAETAARRGAEEHAEIARQVVAFLEETLQGSEPETNRGRDVKVSELLDQASARVATDFEDQPLVEAGVRTMIGRVYYSLGRFDAAETHLRAALEIRLERLGEGEKETIASINMLGAVLWRKGNLTEATSLMRRGVELWRKNRGPDAHETLEAMSNLAVLLETTDAFEEAESLIRQTIAGLERTLGDRDLLTLKARNNLAHIRHRQHGFAEAETLYRHDLEVTREVSGSDSPDTLTMLAGLAEFLADVGKLDEAETLCREALATRRRVLPAGHIQIGESLTALAKVLARRGRLELAEPLLRESLAIHQAALPDGSMWTAIVEYRLGECLSYLPGRFEEAEEHLLDAHDVIEKSSDQSALGGVLTALVELYKRWHRPDDAAYYKELLDDAMGR